MKESEAIEKMKNMRLYMQIEDKNNDCKFTEDDYKANEMAIQALEKQIPKKPKIKHLGSGIEVYCPSCNESHIFMDARFGFKYCQDCGQKLDWSDK